MADSPSDPGGSGTEPNLELPSFRFGRKRKKARDRVAPAPVEDTVTEPVTEPVPAPVGPVTPVEPEPEVVPPAEPAQPEPEVVPPAEPEQPEPAVVPPAEPEPLPETQPETPETQPEPVSHERETAPEETAVLPTPVAAAPVAEPGVEEPARDVPVAGEPVAEPVAEPALHEPVAEPALHEPVADEHVTDEPVAEPRRKAPRERTPFTLPHLNPRIAAVVTGVLVGLFAVVLAIGASRGCEAVRGVGSCGGFGLFALLAILAIEVLLGAFLLRAWDVPDPTSTSFLGVGLVAVLAMLFFLRSIDSVWMFLVIPVLTAMAFLLSWWVTLTFVESAEE